MNRKLFEIKVNTYIWQLCQQGKFEKALRIEDLMIKWCIAVAGYKLLNAY